MRLILLRHSEPLQQAICYGHTQVEVHPMLPEKVRELQNLWQIHSPRAYLVHSPALRCQVVAETLWNTAAGLGRVQDARLTELHFGAWEGLPWNQVPRAELDTWAQDWQFRSPPQGESFVQMVNRVRSFWEEWRLRQADAWVVAHAGSLRILWALATGKHPASHMQTPIPFLQPISVPVHDA